MKLFDLFDKMDHYDEAKIEKHLSPNDVKQLPYLKFYLYESILDALDQYYQSSNVITNKLICKADILFNKGLLQQSYKLLERARQHAQNIEKFTYHLVLIRMEEEYLFQEEDRKVAAIHLKRLQEELRIVQNKFENLLEYLKLKNEVASFMLQHGVIRTAAAADATENILNQQYLKEEHQTLSKTALFHFHIMRS